MTSCPSSWFRDPFDAAVRKAIRPATAVTRRKEIVVQMRMPRETFEDIMSPLTEDDVSGLKRDSTTNELIPTRQTTALNHFEYTVKKGSVSDRLFHLDSIDAPPPPPPKPPAKKTDIGEEEDVYEVEAILEKRTVGKKNKRVEYKVKWLGWDQHPQSTTWERASQINKADLAAFEGKPLKAPRLSAPQQHKRGIGCARAHLSVAEQKRGGVVETMSMVCGSVVVHFKEPRDQSSMPTMKVIFLVLTMDKNGHITWPTQFAKPAQAALRMQARALLKKMMDDPLNPVGESMAPALEGVGTSSLWRGAPKRKLVEVDEEEA